MLLTVIALGPCGTPGATLKALKDVISSPLSPKHIEPVIISSTLPLLLKEISVSVSCSHQRLAPVFMFRPLHLEFQIRWPLGADPGHTPSLKTHWSSNAEIAAILELLLDLLVVSADVAGHNRMMPSTDPISKLAHCCQPTLLWRELLS
jgi:hypothetical protein